MMAVAAGGNDKIEAIRDMTSSRSHRTLSAHLRFGKMYASADMREMESCPTVYITKPNNNQSATRKTNKHIFRAAERETGERMEVT